MKYMRSPIPVLLSVALGAGLHSLVSADAEATPQVGSPVARFAARLSPEHLEILDHLSIVYLDDGQGEFTKTIRVSGVNLQLVSGSGATNGNPASPYSLAANETRSNGLGNLIVGYNEFPATSFDRTGSHFIVMGTGNSYSSFAGLASGENNRVEAPHAAALAGSSNGVRGTHSVALGGTVNEVSGGGALVGGGTFNLAAGNHAVVAGGTRCLAGGDFASVSGGYKSYALGSGSSVNGGSINRAEGDFSTVGGGANRTAAGLQDWAAGSLHEEN